MRLSHATFAVQMAREHPNKKMAYLLYVEQGLDAKQVSELTGISTNTLSKYNLADGWDKQRSARRLGPDKLIQRYYEQSNRLMDFIDSENRPANTSELDALAKLASSIQKLDKRTDASVVMSVLMGFNKWLLLVNHQQAKDMVPYQLDYVKQLLSAEG